MPYQWSVLKGYIGSVIMGESDALIKAASLCASDEFRQYIRIACMTKGMASTVGGSFRVETGLVVKLPLLYFL